MDDKVFACVHLYIWVSMHANQQVPAKFSLHGGQWTKALLARHNISSSTIATAMVVHAVSGCRNAGIWHAC